MPSDFLEIEKELYRERHSAELDRRGLINDRADAQVSLLTIFVGIIGYYVLSFPHIELSLSSALFLAAFAVLSGGTLVAGCYVGRLISCDVADYMPNPGEHHAWCLQLIQWHMQQDPAGGAEKAEAEIAQKIFEHFFNAADANARKNDSRDHLIYLSKRWIFVALIGFVFTAGLHLFLTKTSGKIDLDSSLPTGVVMPEQSKPAVPVPVPVPAASNPTPTTAPQQVSTKPEQPPLKRINANDQSKDKLTYLNEQKKKQ